MRQRNGSSRVAGIYWSETTAPVSGELDIIAENERFLVFFEVKTRRNARFAAACEAVTPAKQARLIAAAEAWLQSAPAEKQPRFDVIEVYGEEGAAAPRIRQIENAFGG